MPTIPATREASTMEQVVGTNLFVVPVQVCTLVLLSFCRLVYTLHFRVVSSYYGVNSVAMSRSMATTKIFDTPRTIGLTLFQRSIASGVAVLVLPAIVGLHSYEPPVLQFGTFHANLAVELCWLES